MHRNLSKVLLSAECIDKRVEQLAVDICQEYGNEPLKVIILLHGALWFAADILRRIPRPLEIECLRASSYLGGLASSGTVSIGDPLPNVNGYRVLVVDDILDSGRTLATVVTALQRAGANDVKSAVLLDKQTTRAVPFVADYVGFEIPDEFVVGYGLDYKGLYRNLPCIGVLDPVHI